MAHVNGDVLRALLSAGADSQTATAAAAEFHELERRVHAFESGFAQIKECGRMMAFSLIGGIFLYMILTVFFDSSNAHHKSTCLNVTQTGSAAS